MPRDGWVILSLERMRAVGPDCGHAPAPVSCGVELNVVQKGVPAVIPAEACYLGWQESLTLLAKLVEAEIPD